MIIPTFYAPKGTLGGISVHPALCLVQCISPIFFEVGIPNGVWMHLGITECLVPFLGHCDLDLDFRTIVSGAFLLYYLR